jgi:hypothetical protein
VHPDQRPQTRGAEQRDITVQQHQNAGGATKLRFRLKQRVGGAQLRLLHCKRQAQPFSDRRLQLVRAVADDNHDGLWGDRGGGAQNVLD